MNQHNILNELSGYFKHIYIACGKTDLRKGIDGLVAIIETNFKLDPYSSSMFIFCGGRRDRIKVIVHDRDGFTLLYKRLDNDGKFKWPRSSNEAMELTMQQFKWLTEGLKIEQLDAMKKSEKRYTY